MFSRIACLIACAFAPSTVVVQPAHQARLNFDALVADVRAYARQRVAEAHQ